MVMRESLEGQVNALEQRRQHVKRVDGTQDADHKRLSSWICRAKSASISHDEPKVKILKRKERAQGRALDNPMTKAEVNLI